MTSTIHICFEDEIKPANFPSYETIILREREERPRQATDINISGVRLSFDKSSDNEVSDLWIKSGFNVRMGEAMTQRYVTQHLQSNAVTAVRAPHVYLAFTWYGEGYIVSEYIDGKMCDDSDIPRVAAAVQDLISIPSPSSTPGPVGGGLIEHPFFIDRTSSIWYESVGELQDHVNGILRTTGRKQRVKFRPGQDIHGLCLCVSDLIPANFMKDGAGGIVAVDFGGYSFLPRSFFIFALRHGGPSKLKQHLITVLENPKSSTAGVLVSASCALAPYGTNDIGVPERLKSRLPK